jgi:hypothetical protein
MLKKIHDERIDLINQVDKYQEKLFEGLEKRIDKSKVEAALKEANDFIKNKPCEINLITAQLDKVKLEEQSLRERLFDGSSAMNFESIENLGSNLGVIQFDSLKSLIRQDTRASDYKMVFFKEEDLDNVFRLSSIICLKSGNFLVIAPDHTSVRMAVIEPDLTHFKAKKYLINVFDQGIFKEDIIVKTTSTDDARIVLICKKGDNELGLYIFDEDLNLLRKDFVGYSRFTLNKNSIFSKKYKDGNYILNLQNFNLELLNKSKTLLDWRSCENLYADEQNRLFVIYKVNHACSIVVFEVDEQLNFREVFRAVDKFYDKLRATSRKNVVFLEDFQFAHWDYKEQILTINDVRERT